MVDFSLALWLRDLEALKKVCVEAEKLGFNGFFYGEGSGPECWTVLATLAAATRRIRLGPGITFFHYRHPVLQAKSVATLDVLSGGRAEVRLGLGRVPGYGILLPTPALRVEQLQEGLKIMKLLWTKGEATFKGKHFKLKNASCDPLPLQKPYPPITIAARGPKTLAIAAKHADWVEGFYPAAEFKEKIETLKTERQTGSSHFSLLANVCIARSDTEAESRYTKYLSRRAFSMKRQDRLRARDIVGSPDRCVQNIRRYLDVGVTRFNLIFVDAAELTSLRFFADEVIPQFSR